MVPPPCPFIKVMDPDSIVAIKNWQCELKKGKSSKNSPTTSPSTSAVSTEDKSPFLNYDYEEVPFLPYESYEDYYSSVVPETHSGKFWLYSIKSDC